MAKEKKKPAKGIPAKKEWEPRFKVGDKLILTAEVNGSPPATPVKVTAILWEDCYQVEVLAGEKFSTSFHMSEKDLSY